MKCQALDKRDFKSISPKMNKPGGMDLEKCVAKMARIITAAPEEIKPVLVRMKMKASKSENMKSLGGPNINNEMLANTLAFLKDIQVDDECISGLLKEGKKDLIIREVMNLMPLPCVTCTLDSEFQPGDRPQVRCRRCKRGACIKCQPEPKTGWLHLCKICDEEVQKEQSLPDSLFTSKKRKDAEKNATQGISTENSFELLDDDDQDDEEEEEWEEAARRRADKKKNEEGGRKVPEKKKEENKENEKEKELCKAFKFGGKCPHGMSGRKKHLQWENCNRAHPKVCNKLLAQGTRGCDGKDCERFHPKMCYSSMNTKRCTREKCTFWHCKGTTFLPEALSRYEPPSNSSLGHYPVLQTRRGRSPGRRGQEEHRGREQEGLRRREQEEPRREWEQRQISREEETERRYREDRREREDGERRRMEERKRDERVREERKSKDSSDFLDLAQIVRQEVQRALLTLLPAAGASGSVPGLPRTQVNPVPSWAELLGRSNTN